MNYFLGLLCIIDLRPEMEMKKKHNAQTTRTTDQSHFIQHVQKNIMTLIHCAVNSIHL